MDKLFISKILITAIALSMLLLNSQAWAKIDSSNLEEFDNLIVPIADHWTPENEWTLDPIRLKKWSTHLRFGKRAAGKAWSSQVRFG